MTDDSTQQPDLAPGGTPASASQNEPVAPGPTPAQLLGVVTGTPAGMPATGQTPAQLLGVDPSLADSIDLGEPQGRGISLATDMGKAAGSPDTPEKQG